ncbi:MAG: uroporphyrinogen-III C-methyltransferase [Gemmobacter sp.]
MTAPGFVSFVSSGPGDPDLLTLKAVDRLSRADAVLYDDLSAGPILAHARQGADLVGVGKRAGRTSPRQDHVSRLLVDYARTGARVVRLKSGDAGLFGRLEEEIVALTAAGIAFEIIPGVTSASAAAAMAGIPLTRRLTARRVQFVTGADTSGALPATLDWATLADPEATTVVYMGRRTWPELARQLMAHGLPPDTPALLAESIGHPGARLTRATVATLSDRPELSTGTGPALILYGPLAHPVATTAPDAANGA